MKSLLKDSMRRFFILPAVVLTVVIAGCSSQPAMNPAVVSRIHSGKIVIIMPPGRIFSANFNNAVWFGVSVILAGLTGGISYGILENYLPLYQSATGPEILKQYKDQMSAVPVGNAFVKSVAAVGERIPWVRSPVAKYRKPADGGDMRHMAQRSNVNVVVFVRPWVQFSSSLKKLVSYLAIHVYARDSDGQVSFLSGGTVHVSTDIADTGAPLKHVGVEGIAAGDIDDSAARGARANIWFEKGSARFKRAISMDMEKLQIVLANYLNGRRHAG